MERQWRFLLVLIWFGFMVAGGIRLFSGGFLLTKMVQNEKASCKRMNSSSWLATEMNVNASSDFCLDKKSKVIILVVDALKYDFGVFNESISEEDALPFQNKLKVIHKLLKEDPLHSRMFKFIADPPTTTLQRLKGLTTGTLPTFVDIGSNFASPEINEDNIMDQVRARDLNMIFMGDSTWTELFPDRFKRQYSFPSFNIYDLDTVDREIEKQLPGELGNSDWDVLIAHFLGVDHCGHRYGPLHSEMSRKLTEMDSVIGQVVNQMDDETILFVIGDHGMTVRGDHGGESDDETNALLFAYSKGPKFHKHVPNSEETQKFVNSEMQQIDFVPVLASILGIPVPFSNLGTLNVNLLPDVPYLNFSKYDVMLHHLWHNAKQIQNYFKQYASSHQNTFDEEIVDELENKFLVLSYRVNSIYTEEAFKSFEKDLKIHLRKILKICREVWVNFNPQNMLQGLLITVISIFLQFVLIANLNVKLLDSVFTANAITTIYLINVGVVVFCYIGNTRISFVSGNSNIMVISCMANIFLLAFLIIKNWVDIVDCWRDTKHVKHIFSRILFGVLLSVYFSNSFIVEEQKIVIYVITGLLIYNGFLLLQIISRNQKPKSYVKYTLILLVIIALALLRISFMYMKCREEQGNCSLLMPGKNSNSISLSKLLSKYLSLGPVCDKIDLSSIVFLALFVTGTRMYLQSCGSFMGYSFKVILQKFGPTVLAICVGAHFILSKNKLASLYQLQIDALAWVVYGLFFCQLVVTFVSPLMVQLIKNTSEINVNVSQPRQIIPEIYNKLRHLQSSGNNQPRIPIIYGLPMVYSSVFIGLFVFMALTIAILLGANASNGLFIYLAIGLICLSMTSIIKYNKSSTIEQLMSPDFQTLITWFFILQFAFYVTSHQPTLSQIDWHSAFVGRTLYHDHSNVLSAVLVLLNTFNNVFLMALLYPLISIFPFIIYTKMPELRFYFASKNRNSKESNNIVDYKIETLTQNNEDQGTKEKFDVTRGEINLYENERTLLTSVFKLGSKLIMMQGFRVFCSMVACTIHCRHLMVWKVFAPRFIYEAITTYLFIVMIIISYFLLGRIHKSVVNLITKLTKSV